jgi:hypothetical protein
MSQELQFVDWSDSATCAFELVAREFVVVTAEAADLNSFSALCPLLRRVRKAFGVEAAFICEAADGETVVRRRDVGDATGCDALQSLFGTRLLAASAPESSPHSYETIAVVTSDGVEHGTLCFRIACDDVTPHLRALNSVAHLIANWFEDADLSLSGFAPLAGSSVMGSLSAIAY